MGVVVTWLVREGGEEVSGEQRGSEFGVGVVVMMGTGGDWGGGERGGAIGCMR